MIRRRLTVVLLLLAAGACTTPYRPIAPGTYRPEAGEERIVVVPTRIYFYVNVDPEHPDVNRGREYEYEVLPDGTIYFTVSSNSGFGLRLAMDNKWLWRDGRIAKVDRETGKTTWYYLRD